jgi:hypothetical protein
MKALRTIYERYVALYGNDHDTAAVRGKEEQPAPQVFLAAPLFP